MERSGEMEVFLRVIEQGGFSAAARSLSLTPSAVSKLIGRLERRLGVRLLHRTTRALTLSAEGRAYQQAAEQVVRVMNDAEDAASNGAVRGHLRVNSTLAFGQMYIAPAIPSFLAKYSDLTVDLSFTDDIVDLLTERADVAIRSGTLPDSGLRARMLMETQRVVCASPSYLVRKGHPQKPADLAEHNCIQMNMGGVQTRWPFLEKARPILQVVNGTVGVNNGETLRRMALEGVGIARLGRFHVCNDIKEGRLIELLAEHNPNDIEVIHALYINAAHVPVRVRAFIDHMIEQLPKQVDQVQL